MKKLGGIISEFIFSDKHKTNRRVILLTLLGSVLRVIAALNLDVLADDMLYASQSAGIISAHQLSTHSNPALFYYLTDLAYKLIGYTTLASRVWPLIFGILLIPLSFLLAKKFFSEKIAFFISFFVTFSNFLTRMNFTEQSLIVLFFSFLGVYLGITYLEKKRITQLVLSASVFGLAMLTKYSAPFFILSFLLFSLYYTKSNNQQIFTKKNIGHLVIFLLIILLFSLPFLTFNYLLFKEKGITDVYFSRVIQSPATQQLYSGLAGQDTSFLQNLRNMNNYFNYNLVFKTDILLFLFGVIGLFFWLKGYKSKDNKMLLIFFLIFLIIPFVLQTGGSTLQKHFVFMHFLFAFPAGFVLEKMISKLSNKRVKIISLAILTLTILFISIISGHAPNYFVKSDVSKLKAYMNENTNENTLTVIDDRFYTAQAFWLATPNHFLMLQQFPQFYQESLKLEEQNTISTKVYLIECAKDDCGWGWVSSNQGFNESLESLIGGLKPYSTKVFSTSAHNVYTFTMPTNYFLLRQTDQVQSFYFTPYLYKNKELYVFDIQADSITDKMLYKLSIFIIYLSILLSIISVIYLIFLFAEKEEDN